MSDSKYSTSHLFRSRRAYESSVNHLENNNIASLTKEPVRFNDHYRHHLEKINKRQKRFVSKVNSWNRRKQFIRYVHTICTTTHIHSHKNNKVKITFQHILFNF